MRTCRHAAVHSSGRGQHVARVRHQADWLSQQALAARLAGDELGQAHLFADWPAAGAEDERKASLLAQCAALDASYPGGLAAYVASGRLLPRRRRTLV